MWFWAAKPTDEADPVEDAKTVLEAETIVVLLLVVFVLKLIEEEFEYSVEVMVELSEAMANKPWSADNDETLEIEAEDKADSEQLETEANDSETEAEEAEANEAEAKEAEAKEAEYADKLAISSEWE